MSWTDDELVQMVNNTELGLVASICACDPKLAPSSADLISTGTCIGVQAAESTHTSPARPGE